jgi:hypothetical protein
MNSPIFIGIDLQEFLGEIKKPDLSYWISGKYIMDAQGNRNYIITSINIKGQRPAIVLDI